MSTQVQATTQLSLNASASSVSGLGTQQLPLNLPSLVFAALTNGSAAANKVNQMYQTTGTLALSTAADIDLYAFGGAKDGGGNAITMATIKFLFFQLVGATVPVEADYIILGNKAATSGWTSFFQTNTDSGKIYTGGAFMLFDPGATGYVVGSSTTNHLLTLTAGANSGTVTYNLIVIGATA